MQPIPACSNSPHPSVNLTVIGNWVERVIEPTVKIQYEILFLYLPICIELIFIVSTPAKNVSKANMESELFEK